MLLNNLQILNDKHETDILIKGSRIVSVDDYTGSGSRQHVVSFSRAIAFPGLINSHDHLDFNLFPQLGNKRYDNYVAWSEDIHRQNKDVINAVLKVPKELRAAWGVYKNLINGVTTVVNHGAHLNVTSDLISVMQDNNTLHSVRLEKYWKYKLNKPFAKKKPFVVHVGEGVDYSSRREIDTLVNWNLYKRELIGVHGIAMTERQAACFKGLVWCPASNFFLIGETATIGRLAPLTEVVFGTDSTLSASWNIWDHLRQARETHMVGDAELYNMLTVTPAELWGLKACGKLQRSYDADIVIAKRKYGLNGYNALYALNPEDILMVMHKGKIKLFDAELMDQLNDYHLVDKFKQVVINGSPKYIYGDLPALLAQIKNYYPGARFPFERTGILNEADFSKYLKHS